MGYFLPVHICALESLHSCTLDVKATGGRLKGKTAVDLARGYSDIVEIISAHKPQPRGELHTKVHSRSPFQMKNLNNFGVLGPISIFLVLLAF